jgi:uncharacterized protein YndB with AHSA1/START domain
MNESKPVNVEVTITASAEKVWQVLTNVELIPKFMMPVKNFKPEIGNEFTFTGSNNGKEYPTHCRIIELIVNKKLSYTWNYEHHPAETIVTFELEENNAATVVKLTHSGLEAIDKFPEVSVENHIQGWTWILNGLKKEVEG